MFKKALMVGLFHFHNHTINQKDKEEEEEEGGVQVSM
jgi:hypothetical protein